MQSLDDHGLRIIRRAVIGAYGVLLTFFMVGSETALVFGAVLACLLLVLSRHS